MVTNLCPKKFMPKITSESLIAEGLIVAIESYELFCNSKISVARISSPSETKLAVNKLFRSYPIPVDNKLD